MNEVEMKTPRLKAIKLFSHVPGVTDILTWHHFLVARHFCDWEFMGCTSPMVS